MNLNHCSITITFVNSLSLKLLKDTKFGQNKVERLLKSTCKATFIHIGKAVTGTFRGRYNLLCMVFTLFFEKPRNLWAYGQIGYS